MKPFIDSDRYDYGLTSGSLVMDVGSHKGNFAAAIFLKFSCFIECFEPVAQFYHECRRRFAAMPKISVFNYGLGNQSHLEDFIIKGDMSGPFADQGPFERVQITGIGAVTPASGCDLIKINIEGGEYPLLDAILDQGLAPQFKNIQVQFHGIAQLDPVNRRNRIRDRLRETHEEMYCEPFVWEGWRLK